jgi:hypothetical protein
VDIRERFEAGEAPAPAKTPWRRDATACVRAVKLLRLAGSLSPLSDPSSTS